MKSSPAPSGRTTGMTGRPYLRAKSRSRWSCAGQPKMAPVPYSDRMKLAIQTPTSRPSKGWITFQPVSKPIFSACSMSAWLAPPLRHSATKAAAAGSASAICTDRGWSGARPMKLAPNRVSGRVV